MNVSSINCTPIRPKANFGNSDGYNQHNEIHEMHDISDEFNKIVKSNDIKGPFAMFLSLLVATGTAFGTGKALTNCFTSKIANNTGVMVENGLKKASKAMQDGAKKLLASSADAQTTGAKAKHWTGKLLEKTEAGAKSLYHKLATSPAPADIPKGLSEVEAKQWIANKALSNLVGKAAAAGGLYYAATADNNGDGVKDFMQTSQSFLKSENTLNAMNLVGDLLQAVT